MKWYALYVETGREDLVRTMIHRFLDKSLVHAIVPRRKLKEKKQGRTYEVFRKLFPGYVLVNTQMDVNTYYGLKNIPGYYRLLNRFRNRDNNEVFDGNNLEEVLENYLFSTIDDEEMTLILQLIDDEETIDYSTIYVENSNVTVYNGPLKGKESIIKKIDKRKRRAQISLEFMGNEMSLDVGIEVLATI
ncbi:antiterminator LoaP [Paenibacillus sp. LMG 31461]|uniref:Antiterminator LoaP n=1 Tax=Paenibacillus plantarum TaxID=2654975 RepID=A0ABX1X8G0_9BACL|nr:antiterminator LoaP [Paenibacillus plantarum]NOU64738.1 antiterminator LoaP [Paenibacillus plantarum]